VVVVAVVVVVLVVVVIDALYSNFIVVFMP
jgi:hypothetical protein